MPRDFVSLFPNKNTISILFLTALVAGLSACGTSYEINNAYGHANPVSYSPSANSVITNNENELLPEKVVILFSERPEPKVSYMHVTNSKNEMIDNNDFKITGQNDRQATVTLDKNKLSDGVYSVSWLVLSRDDGHISKGSYIFRIQSPQQQSQQIGASAQQNNNNNSFFVEQALVDTINMTLKITPFQVGENNFNVTLTDESGKFPSNVNNVILAFTNQQVGLGPIVANLNKTGDGRFVADGSYLSQEGKWEIKVTAQRSGAYDLNHTFEAVTKTPNNSNILSSS
jgi:methionine-rich copper-binding protein CopC/nitrogen fixation protein FixH